MEPTDLTYPDPGYQHQGEENQRRVGNALMLYTRYAVEHYGSQVDREDTSMVMSDLISDLLHLGLERGEDPVALLNRAATAFVGDFEDEPDEEIARTARAAHERLATPSEELQRVFHETVERCAHEYGTVEEIPAADGYPTPPGELADAWDRYRGITDGDISQDELRRLDEWRADVHEEHFQNYHDGDQGGDRERAGA